MKPVWNKQSDRRYYINHKEEIAERMKAYGQRPEVKARRRELHKKRYNETKERGHQLW